MEKWTKILTAQSVDVPHMDTILPPTIARYIEDIANSIGVPVQYIFVPFLSAISGKTFISFFKILYQYEYILAYIYVCSDAVSRLSSVYYTVHCVQAINN